ncbi:DUF2516 family protein [Cellulomonas composti]|uniref:DUF2516 domain-containing protein n=1 Tax=Cellulomonas composti TaxID=266130 RepID=A0A511J7H1_9CELL|nr:DUF2516 family protein [Cellulomonas composti]GEL93924.1 hypothetical protein CCO02nite_05820 [Cellulomonas composti]
MGLVGTLQWFVFLAFMLVIFALCVWALVDCARRPAAAFVSAGKRTKNLWLTVTGIATVVSFLTLPPLSLSFFLGIVSAVAAIVYLVDVKPAVEPYSRRGGGGGPRGPSGGW